jgi:hypothetical protein
VAGRSGWRGVLDAAKKTSAVAIIAAIITPRQIASPEFDFPRRFAAMRLPNAKQMPQGSQAL